MDSMPPKKDLFEFTSRKRHDPLDVLEYIELSFAHRGFAPTFEEIMAKFGIASKNAVYKILRNLQTDGYIIIHKYKKRGIQLGKRMR